MAPAGMHSDMTAAGHCLGRGAELIDEMQRWG